MEEVDAGLFFQSVNAEGELAHLGDGRVRTGVFFVLYPNGNAFVTAILYCYCRHKVIFGHRHASACHVLEYVVAAINGSAFTHIERVAKTTVAPTRLYLLLKICPETGVEISNLWRHIRHVESLVVGFAAVKSVGRRHKVAVVVTRSVKRIIL